MKKVGVFYWSGTGNTQAMAEAIGEGLAKAGVEYDVINILIFIILKLILFITSPPIKLSHQLRVSP